MEITITKNELLAHAGADQLNLDSSEEQKIIISILKHFKKHGAKINLVEKSKDKQLSSKLKLHIGDKYFFSLTNFLWDSLPSLVALAVNLIKSDPGSMITSAATVIQKIFTNLSILEPSSIHFKTYIALAELEGTRIDFKPLTLASIVEKVSQLDKSYSSENIREAVNDLEKKHLFKKQGESYTIEL